MRLGSGVEFLCLLSVGFPIGHASITADQYVLQHEVSGKNGFQPGPEPYFMSPEHTTIGNSITLKFPKSTVPGSDFAYDVKGNKLSFGDIIALAGDHFYKFTPTGACAPSISDDWDTRPNKSIDVAKENVNLLRTDWLGHLRCVLDVIKEQQKSVERLCSEGLDVAQAYKKEARFFDRKYTKCSIGFAKIAFCNPDHFNNDAERAYKSVHSLALLKAVEAFDRQDETGLKEAYFIEAYGQHYLTDMFSTGHMRTPRRVLHSATFAFFAPGDQCARHQHDEECATGLWVTNREGHSWASYGDKQFSQGRCAKNRQIALETSQVSVDEIFSTFKTGKAPKAIDFAALKKIPIFDQSFGSTNFVPIFEASADRRMLLFRERVDERDNPDARRSVSIKQSEFGWAKLKKKIQTSDSFKNTYVYTKSFMSDQKFVHVGRVNSATRRAAVNIYGTVDASKFGQFWSMSSQGYTIPDNLLQKGFSIDAQSISDNLIALTGRQAINGQSSKAIHIGLRISPNETGQLKVNEAWKDSIDDGNGNLIVGETVYGQFDKDSKARFMIKYFTGKNSNSKMEFWSLASSLNSPPVKHSEFETSELNFLFSHKIDLSDSFSTLVGYSGGSGPGSPGLWYFCNWKLDYKERQLTTITETNAGRPHVLLSDSKSGNLIRVFIEKTNSQAGIIRINVLKPRRDEKNGSISFDGSPTVTEFPITWQTLAEEDYLLWFVHDVDGDGITDLVAYTTDSDNVKLKVVVFPGQADRRYGPPVVSSIGQNLQLVTAKFMKPLYTVQGSYTYPDKKSVTSGAIMSFFDNHGIIAMRTIAPTSPRGSFKFELVGQDPAIAGQVSLTLGDRPGNWMGLKRRSQRVGIVPL